MIAANRRSEDHVDVADKVHTRGLFKRDWVFLNQVG